MPALLPGSQALAENASIVNCHNISNNLPIPNLHTVVAMKVSLEIV
jgi:hypothetical protein